MEAWYCTRADVKSALDSKETARNNAQVDRGISAGSRAVEGGDLLNRRFYPELATRYFDWPNDDRSRTYRLWLGANELISVTTLTAGGTVLVEGTDFILRNSSGRSEPPYDHVELLLSASADFAGSADTHQRAISILGLYGYRNDETALGLVNEALDASETGVDVTNSAGLGVGALARVDNERFFVTGHTYLDTTQDSQSAMSQSDADDILDVTDGTAFFVGEVVLVNSEKMLIVEIAGNNLIVKRAWDGSTLASHLTAQDVYAPRRLTVQRGVLGTTAATHSDQAPLYRFDYPSLVQQISVAEAISSIEQEKAGYARTSGSGDNQMEASGKGLADLRKRARARYGRSNGIEWI